MWREERKLKKEILKVSFHIDCVDFALVVICEIKISRQFITRFISTNKHKGLTKNKSFF